MTNQEIADLRERLTAAHPTTELQRRLEAARADADERETQDVRFAA